ncbi:zinc ribbon domain-containing protein [Vibrio agarivorans]|uniref:Zinc ribbon domain-containing protein n=1 Tax=Vibrio agarivorans TaxID=153622 RepID=A0ABT7Y1K8_9VIBR|nr:zinc ribbon domain-containing protein [Vibrio agarivorans]MDN2481927.1 zinc ribbon domain-containing protein [Vibrio agarivorans]
MTENICPKCQAELEWDAGYVCQACDLKYNKIGNCPDCSSQLEKLQACGAASYFCNTCNELKSKSRVQFKFEQR